MTESLKFLEQTTLDLSCKFVNKLKFISVKINKYQALDKNYVSTAILIANEKGFRPRELWVIK
jgi:hypothetical protein